MNEVVTSKTKTDKKLNMGLQSRLLYLLLKCPMLQNRGQGCDCGEQDDIETEPIVTDRRAGCTAAGGRRQHADDDEVILQVTVPYALRRAARAAHLDCNQLARKALARQLKKTARK
mgnify:CR=1 FL=1